MTEFGFFFLSPLKFVPRVSTSLANRSPGLGTQHSESQTVGPDSQFIVFLHPFSLPYTLAALHADPLK